MKTSKYGNFKEGGFYWYIVPFTSEKLTEKKIEIHWNIWRGEKKVWRILPSITLSYTGFDNIYVIFEFLKISFSFQWFNWSSPQNKTNGKNNI